MAKKYILRVGLVDGHALYLIRTWPNEFTTNRRAATFTHSAKNWDDFIIALDGSEVEEY